MNLKKKISAIARKSNFLFSAVQSLRRMYFALCPVRGKGNRIIFEGGGFFTA
ncbi:hypothetical protein [Alistipes sp.]|uniref:hypothetical protein n=1 Tax=Alistipes sp. TaxID=1872444 RepID=UPI001F91AA88|nr:hypothetical protein [Alistipes sp.]HJC76137.1 hypothetical protein [Candidatus Alistipes excrementavium]